MSPNAKSAFTLIELSIVLVIIALLAGGVLVGRSLLRQSEVASIMVDEQKYIAAIKAFKDKYAAFPGDMANATTYWGAAGGTIGTNYTTDCYASGSATNPATCNGNGDGMIAPGGSPYLNEALRTWQHLANAGFIEGSFTGTGASGGTVEHLIGTNCPKSKLAGGGFGIGWFGTFASYPNIFDGFYGHRFYFGAAISGAGPAGVILTGGEALAIDSKYDDGKPAYGIIRTWKNSAAASPNCATTAVSSTAEYSKSQSVVCSLIITTGF